MVERKATVQTLKALNYSPYIITMNRNCLSDCTYLIRTRTSQNGFDEVMALSDQKCNYDISRLITTSNYCIKLASEIFIM